MILLLLVIHCVTGTSLLKETNTLYEDWRHKA